MKTRWFFILLPLSFALFSCVSQTDSSQFPDYPDYSEVIVEFLNDYSISEITRPNQFSMAKKPDGWHAMIIDKESEKTIQDELFWVRTAGNYSEVNFPLTNTDASNPEYKSLIEDWTKNHYSGILPYWGYVGWDKDVIDDYGENANLSDTLLNALARAYVSYASNLLNNNTGFSSKQVRFNLPEGQNALSQKQLSKFREYQHKGINTYYQLWQMNPDFETFVADIYNVYSNQVMNSFLTISYYQNHDEAKNELKEGLYDSYILDMARRYLSSCEPDAILIVNGDIDTYPLLYLQESEGYRKDVSVINISLLNTSRYISYLMQGIQDREPVMFSLPEEFYQNNSNGYFFVTNQVESSEVHEVLDFVASDDPRTRVQQASVDYDYIPSKKLKLIINISNLPDYQLSENDPEILIRLENNYLMLNHFCFLDILSTNNFKRPIYFAVSVSTDNFLNLKDYFQCEGMAYKITPVNKAQSANAEHYGYIDTDVQYEKLMEIAAFRISDDTQKYYDIHKRMTMNYRWVYGRLALELVDENNEDKALRVLEYCSSEFSPEKTEYGYRSFDLIEAYYKINKVNAANTIVEEIFHSTADYFTNSDESLDVSAYDARLNMLILKSLMNLTTKYINGSPLQQEIDETNNSILEKYYQDRK